MFSWRGDTCHGGAFVGLEAPFWKQELIWLAKPCVSTKWRSSKGGVASLACRRLVIIHSKYGERWRWRGHHLREGQQPECVQCGELFDIR